jgi:two-component system, response regulator PdtaR
MQLVMDAPRYHRLHGAYRADKSMLFGRIKGTQGWGRERRAVRTVLIVEDEPLVAFENEHGLEQAGYTIAATVEDYDHAARVIGDDDVDLVIADVSLRGEQSGIDVAMLAQAKGLPVLFVTGACPVEARHLALGCLAKPYAPRDLVAAINVIDAILRGVAPARLPAGLSLFEEDAA